MSSLSNRDSRVAVCFIVRLLFASLLVVGAGSASAQWLPAPWVSGPIYFNGGSVGVGTTDTSLITNSGDPGFLIFGNNPALRLTNSNGVSIGEESFRRKTGTATTVGPPVTCLDYQLAAPMTGFTIFDACVGAPRLVIDPTTGVVSMDYGLSTGDIFSQGLVGIGTPPTAGVRLKVAGKTQIVGDTEIYGWQGIGMPPIHPMDISGTPVANGPVRELAVLYDNRGWAAGNGGALSFGGRYGAAGTYQSFATIQGVKENGVDGDYAAAMMFFTRQNGGALTERMRINSAGEAGIGTGPVSGVRLAVGGTIRSLTGGFQFPDGTTQATAATSSPWSTGSGSAIYYTSGSVGIGTNAPSTLFHVNGSGVLGRFQGTAGSSYVGDGQLYSDRADGLYLQFANSGAPINFQNGKVYFDGLGNVGIGTPAPAASLHVKGAATTSGSARRSIVAIDTAAAAQGAGGGISFGGNYSSTASTADFANIWGIKENGTDGDTAGALLFATHLNGATPAERMRIGSDGLVTIGAAGGTTTKLAVNGMIQSAGGGFKFPDGTIQTTAAVGAAPSQWTAGTPSGTIYYSAGNVAIGTNTGTAPLTVVGSPGFTAMFTVNGGDSYTRINSSAGLHPFVDMGIGNTTGTPYGEIRVGDDAASRNLVLVKDGGWVGIGTNQPNASLHVKGTATVSGAARRNVVAFDSSPSALGAGGGISFGGNYSATSSTADFANIWGIKENAVDSNNAGALLFATHGNGGTPTERMRIGSTGLVTVGASGGSGIKLTVNGDINVTGNINAKYQDVAEWVPAAEQVVAGTVVVLDPAVSNQVISSSQPYATSVAGVVSDNPGLILGEASDTKVKVATTGRVKVKVDATKGAIRIGDLLVTSDQPGAAMRSEPVDVGGIKIHRPGTIIGKALQPLAGGQGEILVLLSLQ